MEPATQLHSRLGWRMERSRRGAQGRGVFSVAEELRDFRDFLVAHTVVEELRGLNLLGIQRALCEASKWLFYLRSSFVSVMEIWPLAQSLLRGKRLGIRFPSPPGAFPAYWRRSMSRVCG